MSEYLCPFSAQMARALYRGRKAVTRRPVKLESPGDWECVEITFSKGDPVCQALFENTETGGQLRKPSPFGGPGDTIIIQEPWQIFFEETDQVASCKNNLEALKGGMSAETMERVIYKSAWPCLDVEWMDPKTMPAWMSRMAFENTGVTVQHINEMDNTDYLLEGVAPANIRCNDPWGEFHNAFEIPFIKMWDSIYAHRGFAFSESPLVWVTSLRPLWNLFKNKRLVG